MDPNKKGEEQKAKIRSKSTTQISFQINRGN
uniref:Uncharacterized protein n=1 Tax=Arundo donax TaxID=35708 RepID=A0A0A9BZ92_ARUDO